MDVRALWRVGSSASSAMLFQAQVAQSGTGFVGALLNSMGLVLATELGDKTFFIAALLAMQKPVALVYLGCFGALAFMTVISALIVGLGVSFLELYIPRKYTKLVSIILLAYFGINMIYESLSSILDEDGGNGELLEEKEEAEDELKEIFDEKQEEEDDDNQLEEENEAELHDGKDKSEIDKLLKVVEVNFAEVKKSMKVFSKSFSKYTKTEEFDLVSKIFSTIVFAEIGDKSQIATIAMASSNNFFAVALGGVFGHALCTGIAVSGGYMLAEAEHVSGAQINFVGGILFLGFAVHSYLSI